MHRVRLAWLLALALPVMAADVCTPADVSGPYGFQLAGTTTISGSTTPMAAIGRWVFDGKGNISGVSSVNFNGLFLGNPVTGTYELKVDCTLTFKLQDDSGAYQQFSGKAVPHGDRVEFHQTDAGTGGRGLMLRTAGGCQSSDFHGGFNFAMGGKATPFSGEDRQSSTVAKALAEADGAGNLTITHNDSKTQGTYTIDSDCLMTLEFGMGDGDAATLNKLRGVLVNDGKDVLAVQTDPEQVTAVHFSR